MKVAELFQMVEQLSKSSGVKSISLKRSQVRDLEKYRGIKRDSLITVNRIPIKIID